MRIRANAPSQTQSWTKLSEVIWCALRNGRDLRPVAQRTYTRVYLVTRDRRLRLGIPSPVPAQAVGNGQPRIGLPFVLPIQAQSGLVVREEGVGGEGIQPIQSKTLEVEVRIRYCRRRGHSRAGCGIRIEIAQGAEVVPAGTPAREGVFAVYK